VEIGMRHYRSMVPWCSRGPRAFTKETGRPLARAGHRLRAPSVRPRRMFPARARAPARKGSRQEAPGAPGAGRARAPGARTAPRTRGEHPCSFHRLILSPVDNPTVEPDTHAGRIRDPAGSPTTKNLVVPRHLTRWVSPAPPTPRAPPRAAAAPGRRLAVLPVIGHSARAGAAASRPPCARRPVQTRGRASSLPIPRA